MCESLGLVWVRVTKPPLSNGTRVKEHGKGPTPKRAGTRPAPMTESGRDLVGAALVAALLGWMGSPGFPSPAVGLITATGRFEAKLR